MGEDRICGTCHLCCVVFYVPVLQKPEGVLCFNHTVTAGCGIYNTRPEGCRRFECLWLTEPTLEPEWKPEVCGFVLAVDPNTGNLEARTAPGSPDAWRQAPYEAQFRRWSEQGLADFRHVIILSDGTAAIVLPDREVACGPISPGQTLHISRSLDENGAVRIETEIRTPNRTQPGA